MIPDHNIFIIFTIEINAGVLYIYFNWIVIDNLLFLELVNPMVNLFLYNFYNKIRRNFVVAAILLRSANHEGCRDLSYVPISYVTLLDELTAEPAGAPSYIYEDESLLVSSVSNLPYGATYRSI